jgi:hypothetical protein
VFSPEDGGSKFPHNLRKKKHATGCKKNLQNITDIINDNPYGLKY